MFKKNKVKENIDSFDVEKVENTAEVVLEPYTRTMKDFFAPSDISLPERDYIVVNNKYIRSYSMQGYPSVIHTGWLNDIYNYSGNMDTSIYVEPEDDRTAQTELTKKITQYQAQLYTEQEKGSNASGTELQMKIESLIEERAKLEQNRESIYRVSINSNLICDSLTDLNKETQILESKLKGKRMSFVPTFLRMDDGFKSALPMADIFIKDKLRNLNTSALGTCFPFYNSEISHPHGVFIGINTQTRTPLTIDFYSKNKNKLENTNISIFGKAGSGKSFFVSLLTMRSALQGIRTVIIDPENEYSRITKALGGVYIKLTPNSKNIVNPFDIEEEDELDGDDKPTGRKIVDISAKVSDVLNLLSVMAGESDKEKISLMSKVGQQLYKNFGITSAPESLYYAEQIYDKKTETFYHAGMKKKMPTLSDYCALLETYSKTEEGRVLKPVLNALGMFQRNGINGMFDGESTIDSDLMSKAPLITFDVEIEDKILRPIAMYVALSWAWEKFGKKNLMIRKRIICDEAWMLVNVNMAGYQYTSMFLETCARRIRKRNGGLLVASQNFIEFASSKEGLAVLTNTAVHIFLKQSTTDIDSLQKHFKLSDGEKDYLLTANTGEILIKTENETCTALVYPFEVEKRLIERDMTAHTRS
ncbi:MAG: DUF87 domain-containing protein [Oscillospiraceae bacterium]